MNALLRRLAAFLLEPAHPAESAEPASAPTAEPPALSGRRPAPSWSAPMPPDVGAPLRGSPARRAPALPPASPDPVASARPVPPAPPDPVASARAVVLGAAADVPAVAAACAGELRARHRAPAALVCLWRPGGEPPPGGVGGDDRAAEGDDRGDGAASPAGATTPGARRVAAALASEGLRATACGRLAWLALPDPPGEAASVLRRGLALAGVPVAIAVAGPRPTALEPILATADIAVAVLPADAGEALRELALAHLPCELRAIVGPLPPGPPRWAALAGLTRLRSLPGGAP